MRFPVRFATASALLATLGGCTFSSTATEWHGRVGLDGKPVYVKTHTNIGLNFLIILPMLGRTSLPVMIDELTHEIANETGDNVRMVESSAENYWYGFAPLTWIITPVITTVAADYHPSAEQMQKDQAAKAKEKSGP